MNPDTTIRTWLLACGKQFGIREAHDYRWPDALTRPAEMYFEYKVLRSRKDQDGTNKAYTSTSNTLHRTTWQRWITTVQIDLHRSQNGMFELAACVVAAQDNPSIKSVFNSSGCAFLETVSLTNETDFNDGELSEKYHHRLIVDFYDHVQINFDEVNEAVDEINVTLGL